MQILFAWYLDIRAQSHSVCLILGQPRWELFLATRSASTADSAATRDCSLTSATKKRWRRKIKNKKNDKIGRLSSVKYMSYVLGTGYETKTDKFSEKIETALTSPLIYGKSYCNIFWKALFKVLYKGPKSAISIFGLKVIPPWNFSENSSVLVPSPVPNFCEWIWHAAPLI